MNPETKLYEQGKSGMNPETLSRMKQTAEAATPGPWDFFCVPDDAGFRVDEIDVYGNTLRLVCKVPESWPNGERNAAYIALCSPANVLGLIRENERLQEELQRLQEELQAIYEHQAGASL